MDRIQIAQLLLDALGRGTYLEIGVNTGCSFIPIQAKRKWGVDPAYVLTNRRLFYYAVLEPMGLAAERLFRMTSDDFFDKHKQLLASHPVDVCFVDGLHTYEQSLRDVLHALEYLKPSGVILLHDCNPSSEITAAAVEGIESAAMLAPPGWTGAWSGDVWKTIVHLRSLRDDLEVFVLDCDTGIGVVRKSRTKPPLSYSEEEIRGMDYDFFSKNRNSLLGLKPAESFEVLLRSHSGIG